jgi:hypothetical protein
MKQQKPKELNMELSTLPANNTCSKPKELDWEKEFEKRFVLGDGCIDLDGGMGIETVETLKEFIKLQIQESYWLGIKVMEEENEIQDKQTLTQQRTELKCEDCSPEDKHICPTDRSTTRISRHCAGEDIQTIAGTLLKSKEWKEWYKYASENMLFDVDETETVDMMSDGHFNSFIEFTKSKVRTELLEEIKNYFRYKRFGCTDESGKIMADFVLDVVKQEVTNLLNKKDETK